MARYPVHVTIPPSSDRYGHDILASDPHLREERRRRPTSERITAEPGLLKARQQGLIEIDGDTIRPTTRGRHFLNELLMLFLAE